MLISYRKVLLPDGKVRAGGSRKFSEPQNFEFENVSPGYYMHFLLQKKSQSISGDLRVPSIAKIVKLELPI